MFSLKEIITEALPSFPDMVIGFYSSFCFTIKDKNEFILVGRWQTRKPTGKSWGKEERIL